MHRNHLAMCLLLGLGGVLLVAVAEVPVSSVLPLLLVGGCLLMHLLMPHGDHHGGPPEETRETTAVAARPKQEG
jgi:hypothetical protein